jgi:hypothetical protein
MSDLMLEYHKRSDHGRDGASFDSFTCNCRELFAAHDRGIKAGAWDERGKARPSYLGPDDGHYDDDCMGWEDCHCASWPNPYRDLP